jgi:hypothetical protein
MQRIWPAIYAALVCFSALAGAGVFGTSSLHTNVDWVFVALSFLLCLTFPSLAVLYARSHAAQPFSRASLFRGLRGGWWIDPLQCLRVSILLLAGLLFGALFSLQNANVQSIMVTWWQAAMLLGLVIGERAVYVLFHHNIA